MRIKTFFKKIFGVPETPLSEADLFLQQFDVNNLQKSASQIHKIKYHNRIAQLRDQHR